MVSHFSYALCMLDFKLSPCFECCIISFGHFPGVWVSDAGELPKRNYATFVCCLFLQYHPFLFHHPYCIKRVTKLWQSPSVTLFRFWIITTIFESVLRFSSLRRNQKYRPNVKVETVTLLIMREVLGSKLGPKTDCPDRNVGLSLSSSGPSHKCRVMTSNQKSAAYPTRCMHWSLSNHLAVHYLRYR
jgi:hypothetical protein